MYNIKLLFINKITSDKQESANPVGNCLIVIIIYFNNITHILVNIYYITYYTSYKIQLFRHIKLPIIIFNLVKLKKTKQRKKEVCLCVHA